MKNTKKTQANTHIPVSVIIPARNEEGTIRAVLQDILSQREKIWRLLEIEVICDGCEDRTASRARAVADHRISVHEYRRRKGKTTRVSAALHAAKGEILIIFDADVRLEGDDVIEHLVRTFRRSPQVMLVGGNVRTYPPKGFFQKAIYTSYDVYYASREKLKDGHNVFGCSGSCLALRRKFARSVTIPSDVICEDVYLYFACLARGHVFRHAKSAIVHHRLAANLRDFLRQVFRSHPESIDAMLRGHFGDLVRREFQRPLKFYLSNVSSVFLKNPLGTAYMILLKILCKPLFPKVSSEYRLGWFSAISTKQGGGHA